MAYEIWSQDIFSKGELSPFMYGRATVNEYGNGLKKAQNVLTYPTGAAGKRFGTLFNSFLSPSIISSYGLYLETFVYLNECTYQLVFFPNFLAIYLEGIIVETIATTLTDSAIDSMSTTVLGKYFQFTAIGAVPSFLYRLPNAGNIITAAALNVLTLTTAVTAGLIVPVQFTTSGALPTSTPQLLPQVTYFVNYITTSTAKVYLTAYDAKFAIPGTEIAIADNGSGVNTLIPQNDWHITTIAFKNRPTYDFNGAVVSYDALTFTPSAKTGSATITVSGAGYSLLTSAYVGGSFIGGGGTSRITAVAGATSFTVAIQDPFNDVTPIQGSLAVLSEPAWSDIRGWPQVCSSYQNRSLFANTRSLPNGFWASVINDYIDFGDLTNDDDDAIAWYPSSNNVNYIKFIVPYRSITVHTNTGIYSSPLSDVAAITPNNFTLQLQDSTPASVLIPQAIDNQVLVLSGNDAHQMLWDGINNAYTSDIVSVISEQLIRDPVDEVAFADLLRAGSRYVFIINRDGSMATFQTLISQNVAGFTPQIMEQSYGNASFIQAASSPDGRCWFIVARSIATAQPANPITGYTSTTLHSVASNYPTYQPTAIQFTTGGMLPTSSTTTIVQNKWYWAVGTDVDNFTVYEDQAAALAGVTPILFTSAGTASNSIPYPVDMLFTLEELTQDTFLDCAVYFNNNGAPTDTINTNILFNAQEVKMVGDGFGFSALGINNQVQFQAHGVSTPVNEGYIGFPIHTIIEPMPLSMANGPSAKNTTLTKPKHIRFVNFMFNNTIGGTINGVDIALEPFDMAHIGEPPYPGRGFVQLSIMKGWDDFNNPSYTIEHSEPFNIQLLGAFYAVDI